MELKQEEWLKQPLAKVRGPIVAGDQGSRQGHQCSKGTRTAAPLGGKQTHTHNTVDRLCRGVRMQELLNETVIIYPMPKIQCLKCFRLCL
jgi:hypothetical protein